MAHDCRRFPRVGGNLRQDGIKIRAVGVRVLVRNGPHTGQPRYHGRMSSLAKLRISPAQWLRPTTATVSSPTVKLMTFEVPPPTGFVTVTDAVPASAMSLAGMIAVSLFVILGLFFSARLPARPLVSAETGAAGEVEAAAQPARGP